MIAFETYETVKDVKENINNELEKIFNMLDPAYYEEATGCIDCILHNVNKLIADRKETFSEVMDAIAMIKKVSDKLEDVNSCITGGDICYYVDNKL